ncbi:MAG: alanine racemase [Firmicutes bacterium]|nr:alanine racemase [Bacillota bacterium]
MSLIAKIDCDRFISNIKAIKSKVRTNIIAVVKADAYGHGASVLAPVAEPFIDGFAVIDRREATALVKEGITKPIHILSPCERVEGNFWTENMIPTICCLRDIEQLRKLKPLSRLVNLEINTGMNRLGVAPSEVQQAYERILLADFKLHSVFSHLYNAVDVKSSFEQLAIFHSSTANLPKNIQKHISATASVNLPEQFYLNAIRPGLGLYGYGASDIVKPIMTVTAPIIKIFSVKKGEHISYGNFTADKDVLIASIRAGYADGIRRKENPLSTNRKVKVNGVLCPIVGQVCMDITMVDITGVKASYSTPVVIMGEGLSAEDVARQVGTNSYEVLTSFKGRVVREYVYNAHCTKINVQ